MHLRLSQVANKLKLKTSALVSLLKSYGFVVDNKANRKISDKEIEILSEEYFQKINKKFKKFKASNDNVNKDMWLPYFLSFSNREDNQEVFMPLEDLSFASYAPIQKFEDWQMRGESQVYYKPVSQHEWNFDLDEVRIKEDFKYFLFSDTFQKSYHSLIGRAIKFTEKAIKAIRKYFRNIKSVINSQLFYMFIDDEDHSGEPTYGLSFSIGILSTQREACLINLSINTRFYNEQNRHFNTKHFKQ